jgi:hypothetical protein
MSRRRIRLAALTAFALMLPMGSLALVQAAGAKPHKKKKVHCKILSADGAAGGYSIQFSCSAAVKAIKVSTNVPISTPSAIATQGIFHPATKKCKMTSSTSFKCSAKPKFSKKDPHVIGFSTSTNTCTTGKSSLKGKLTVDGVTRKFKGKCVSGA